MVLLQLHSINGLVSKYSKRSLLVHDHGRRRDTAHKRLCFKMLALPSRTQRIMESISVGGEVGGAGGAYSYSSLKRLDQLWSSICSAKTVVQEPQKVVSTNPGSFSDSELAGKALDKFDVIVCGGTLGIFIATSLSSKGLRVAIVEKSVLKGREQEWNISRKELLELVKVGILAEKDIEEITAAKFNPNRCGFDGKGEIWVKDILNLGVLPAKLIEIVKNRFVSLGGVIFEGCTLSTICVYEDAAVTLLAEGNVLSSSLIIDAMGNFSPIVKQIRHGRKPDGVCLVVGSCARGFSNNSTSDVIYSSSSIRQVGKSVVQCFWEGVPLDNLEIQRVIYGIFPTYRDSPLPAAFNRVLQFGDASGIQSPVSFGGFGSLTRHLERLSSGIYEAINSNFLDSYNLSLLNPYMPNLSASWLFQRAMSAKQLPNVPPDFINELLYANFQSMQKLGDPVFRPFLQDVVQFGALAKTLGLVMISKPQILPSIFAQVGFPVLVDWSGHFAMLGFYTFLSTFAEPVIRPWLSAFSPQLRYQWRRRFEAWKYGAGLDYEL
ncbi:FAD/NAD(P)-binding domain containing protein [Parasponia andersonii]|uniref:FAD/NAD(P)-binding domain containing protein n=1 Tax=Parasponia andersonii TaxID=3476 RepID=A0A2P5AD43_PARAD|nr:FAD/NAD(P)-binding domain containing protein [Parasponia andersonii]